MQASRQAIFKREPYSQMDVATIFESDEVIVEIAKIPRDTLGLKPSLQITVHNRKSSGNWDDCSATLDENHFAAIGSVSEAMAAVEAPDWPPQASAIDLPDGTRRHGSTGQLFEVKNGSWVRIPEDVGSPAPSTEGLREWQPIETAPKGCAILVRFQSGEMSVCYQTNHGEPFKETWRHSFASRGEQAPWPLLWMPLPPAPDAACTALTVIPSTSTEAETK